MDVYGNTRTKYDIPLNHLDFDYISHCTNRDELEKIIKILRSGKEGTYPDLEKCAEKQLTTLDPDNKLLRKPEMLKTPRDLDKDEWKQIDEDLKSWVSDVKVTERNLSGADDIVSAEDSLPPVRGSSANIPTGKTKPSSNDTSKKSKRVKPRDYREWDKLDVDAELNKVDENKHQVVQDKTLMNSKQTTNVSETVETTGLSAELRQLKAEREKDKGNEAFRAGDYDEALVYYSRSISLVETVAARNNRAQTYLKLKDFNKAFDDCEHVLQVEPTNLKAILRRAVANQGLNRFTQAKCDLETVLSKEPTNKQALSLLQAVEKSLSDQKSTGRRMFIEEVEGSDSEDVEPVGVCSKPCNILTNGTVDNPTPCCHGDSSKNVSAADETKADDLKSTQHMDESKLVGGQSLAGGDNSGVGVPASVGGQLPSVLSDTQLSSLAESLPPAVAALKDSGNDLFRKGQYGDALDKYNAAVQLMLDGTTNDSPALSVLYSNRAACLMKVGDCQSCVTDCDRALTLCPGSTKPLLRRAMALEALEKYRQAFVDYRQVLNAGSNVEVAQQGADRCASMLQKLDGPTWRDKLPSIPSSSNLAALVSGTTQSVSPASSATRPPVDLAAQNEMTFETCKSEGNALFAKGEYVKAVELFTKCIELFPDRVIPYTNRALCYLRLNQCDEVLNDCNQALSLDFHNVKALFRRAQAYKMQRRYDESMIDLETLLKIDASNSAAKKELEAVLKSKEEDRDKRLQASLRKQRQRVHIEEVDSSSEDEAKNGNTVRGKKPARHQPTVDAGPAKCCGNPADVKLTGTMSTSGSSTSLGGKVPVHVGKLSTPFEFMQAWTGLKGCQDIEAYVRLVEQIVPSDLPKVISNKLDSDFLMLFVRSIRQLIHSGEVTKGFELLKSLSAVARFDTIVMFLSEVEKKEVREVFDIMSATIDTSQLTHVRTKYTV